MRIQYEIQDEHGGILDRLRIEHRTQQLFQYRLPIIQGRYAEEEFCKK